MIHGEFEHRSYTNNMLSFNFSCCSFAAFQVVGLVSFDTKIFNTKKVIKRNSRIWSLSDRACINISHKMVMKSTVMNVARKEKINLDRIKHVIISTHSWPLVPMSAHLSIPCVSYVRLTWDFFSWPHAFASIVRCNVA